MKKQSYKQEEITRRLKQSLSFFEKKDYDKSLADLKYVASVILKERNKGIRKKEKLEFEKRNVKLPFPTVDNSSC